MRHITITLSLGALVAAGAVDDPTQQPDRTKRLVVGEEQLTAEVSAAKPARADAAKSFMIGEADLKEFTLFDADTVLAEPLGSPLYDPGGEDRLDADWMVALGGGLSGVPLDMQPIAKGRVEDPLKRAIEPLALPAPDQPVRAGLVNWHADLPAARAAARASGKPILLFQLLGRLDEAFC